MPLVLGAAPGAAPGLAAAASAAAASAVQAPVPVPAAPVPAAPVPAVLVVTMPRERDRDRERERERAVSDDIPRAALALALANAGRRTTNTDISLPLDDKEARLQYEPRSPTEDGSSSVQRLLVLSTDYMVDPSDIRARLAAWCQQSPTWPQWSTPKWSRPKWSRPKWSTPKWARVAAKVKTHSDSWREHYQLPYLILMLGVLQVALQSTPLRPLSSQLMWAGRVAGILQPWRFLSYVLPHTSVAHLALNVVVQTLVGVPAEAAQGTFRVAAIYAGGALSGALATAIICPTLQMAGSSAAIYAVLTSHLADVFLNKEWISHPGARAGAVIVLAVADAAYTVHHALLYGNLRPRIGLAAHAAGAVMGLPLGMAIYRRGPQKQLLPGLPMTSTSPPSAARERTVLAARVSSAMILGICAAAGVAFLVAVPSPEGQSMDACCS